MVYMATISTPEATMSTFVFVVFWYEDYNSLQMQIFQTRALANAWKETNCPINGWVDARAVRGESFI